MFTKRFFISWLASSLAMFAMSYLWHGVILNDFVRLSYPKPLFLSFAVVVYIIFGLIISKAIDIRLIENYFRRNPILKGLTVGSVLGFFFFLMATVVGISFSSELNIKNLLFDVSWQIVEQGVGGVVVGMVHLIVRDRMLPVIEED